jgi:P4 family phage/plasmid primase-like protien
MQHCIRSAETAQSEYLDGLDDLAMQVPEPERFFWLRSVVGPDDVFELRALRVRLPDWENPATYSGYYDRHNLDALVIDADQLSDDAECVALSLNPVRPGLLDRSGYHMTRGGKAASEADIVTRQGIVIDFDPKRPGKVAATDAEKELARNLMGQVRTFLDARGWPAPMVCDSGNGFHLRYRIDLPTNDGGLVKRVLYGLDARFSCPDATIDTQLGDAPRVIRLYGTWNRKGENTSERPHRRSAVLEMPERLEVVSKEQLEALAAELGTPKRVSVPVQNVASSTILAGPLAFRQQRARAYMTEVSPAIQGQRGDPHSFCQACRLIQKFGLTPDEAYPVLAEWNERCEPPWPENLLRRKLTEAAKKIAEEAGITELSGGIEGIPSPRSSQDVIVCSGHDDDPHGLADAFLTARYRGADGLALRYWRQKWWQWKDGRYRSGTAHEMGTEVTAALPALLPRPSAKYKGVAVTQKRVVDVLGALAGMCAVPNDTEQPAWLGDPDTAPQGTVISVRNGLLVVDDEGACELVPATPNWFDAVCIPVEYDPAATAPKWDEFLARNLEGDAERIALLQEWFGYCLTPNTGMQKFLLMVGRGCNGKSVACGALRALLGKDNVSHVPLERFGDRFSLYGTLGKLANIVPEIGEIEKVAEGQLKAYTSGDPMPFEPKYARAVQAVPTARLVFATNNLPRFLDRTDGIWRRVLLLPFRVAISPEEKVPGMDQADWWAKQGQLPGMLNWALAGLKRLRRQRRFTDPAVCMEALAEYRKESDPTRQFLEENCVQAPNAVLERDMLRRYYNGWCQLHKCGSLGPAKFGQAVRDVFPGVIPHRPTARPGQKRDWCYKGIDYVGTKYFER